MYSGKRTSSQTATDGTSNSHQWSASITPGQSCMQAVPIVSCNLQTDDGIELVHLELICSLTKPELLSTSLR